MPKRVAAPKRAQVVLNLPEHIIAEVDTRALMLNTSRAAYFLTLHHLLGKAVEMSKTEKQVLIRLGEIVNQTDNPIYSQDHDIKTLEAITCTTRKNIIAILEKFTQSNLVEKIAGKTIPSVYSIIVDKNTYRITNNGLIALRAVILGY